MVENTRKMILIESPIKEKKWALRYINLAKHIKEWSEDRSTKVGAVIVNKRNRIISVGYNGFPTGVIDKDTRHERPNKYDFTEHAERNAIYNAERSLVDSTLYLDTFPCPCVDCARAIIQSGIKCVFGNTETFNSKNNNNSKYNDIDNLDGHNFQMLYESGVNIKAIDMVTQDIFELK